MKSFLKRISDGHIFKFEITFQSLKLTVRVFYGMTAIIWYLPYLSNLLQNWNKKMLNYENHISWLWPVKWMTFISENFFVVLVLVVGGLLLSMICALFPHRKWFRILVFLLNFQTLALNYSINGMSHETHSLLIISFWLIFVNLNRENQTAFIKEQNKFFFWMAQISFLGTYFLTGLWKLRVFIAYLVQMGWEDSPRCLAASFSWGFLRKNMDSNFHIKILESLEGVSINHLLWLGVILFQICAPVAAWFPLIQRFYGFLILLFHILTAVFMDVQFLPNQFVALIFLMCHPYQRKK